MASANSPEDEPPKDEPESVAQNAGMADVARWFANMDWAGKLIGSPLADQVQDGLDLLDACWAGAPPPLLPDLPEDMPSDEIRVIMRNTTFPSEWDMRSLGLGDDRQIYRATPDVLAEYQQQRFLKIIRKYGIKWIRAARKSANDHGMLYYSGDSKWGAQDFGKPAEPWQVPDEEVPDETPAEPEPSDSK